jgi:glycosyltransferase involved in cell wall biosynthesis
MAFNPCILIPIYNNKETIHDVALSLECFGLPCVIVDDGSDAETRHVLDRLETDFDWISVIHRTENGGKGAAMATGFRHAARSGYTHAVQIDADGQHDSADVPRFLELAERYPGSLILGKPVFDESAPAARRYGRHITTFWVCIETWATDIKDALCGFRCYPLEPVMKLYAQSTIGRGMVFDTEIAVRLHWNGVPMVNVETKIDYLQDGISHFDYVADNLRISALHAKLLFGMLIRIPRLFSKIRS